jgi:hypothetical protein
MCCGANVGSAAYWRSSAGTISFQSGSTPPCSGRMGSRPRRMRSLARGESKMARTVAMRAANGACTTQRGALRRS